MDIFSHLKVSPQYLRDAIEIEMQKTADPKLASIITIKRLQSDPKYYEENFGLFERMEKASQLSIGTKLESEHKETYEFIKNYLKEHGKLPPAKEVYKHIAKNHLEEFKKYYTYLLAMEKEMKNEMKKAGSPRPGHKYIKRVPKKKGKGWDYFYLDDKGKLSSPANWMDILADIFGFTDKKQVNQKIMQDYKSNELDKKFNLTWDGWKNHIAEYFRNQSRWQILFSSKEKQEAKQTDRKESTSASGEKKKDSKGSTYKIGVMKIIDGLYGREKKEEIQKVNEKATRNKIDKDIKKHAREKYQQSVFLLKKEFRNGLMTTKEYYDKFDAIKDQYKKDIEQKQENNFDTMPEKEEIKETQGKVEKNVKLTPKQEKVEKEDEQLAARDGYFNEKPSEILNVGQDVFGAVRHHFDTYSKFNVDIKQLEKEGVAAAYATKKNLIGDYGLANKDERVAKGETEYKVLASYVMREYLAKAPFDSPEAREKYMDFCRAIVRLDNETTTAADFYIGLSDVFSNIFKIEKKENTQGNAINIMDMIRSSKKDIIRIIGSPIYLVMTASMGQPDRSALYGMDKREQKQFNVLTHILSGEREKKYSYSEIEEKIFGATKISGVKIKKGDSIEIHDEFRNRVFITKSRFENDQEKKIFNDLNEQLGKLYEISITVDYYEREANKEKVDIVLGKSFNSKEEAQLYHKQQINSLIEERNKHIVRDKFYPVSGQVIRAGRDTVDVFCEFSDGSKKAFRVSPSIVKIESSATQENNTKTKPTRKLDLYIESKVERQGGKDFSKLNVNQSQKILKDQYQFKALQYGNAMPDAEREQHTKWALQAFSDMSDILGFPLQQITVNGKLGMAFGARGKGGKNSGMAHYEPSTKMINLTRSSGFGSLAHEWGHFLDNIMTPKMDNFLSNMPVYEFKKVTSKEEIKHGSIFRDGKMRFYFDANAPNPRYPFARLEKGQVRPGDKPNYVSLYNYNITVEEPIDLKYQQLAERIAEKSVASLQAQTKERMKEFPENDLNYIFLKALILEDTYLNSYNEAFARAFETYIADKLEDNGRKNTYLASKRKTTGEDGELIYPQNEYRKEISQLFDEFFNELKQSGELKKAIARFKNKIFIIKKIK